VNALREGEPGVRDRWASGPPLNCRVIGEKYKMDNTIIVALITVTGGVIAFSLTKHHEIKSEWKKEKLNHYKVLLSALSDLAVDGTDKDKANEKFSLAVNTIALVAPQSVISVLMLTAILGTPYLILDVIPGNP
jgi:hypothetical protein